MTAISKAPKIDTLPSAAYKTVISRLVALEEKVIDKLTLCVDSLTALSQNTTHLSNDVVTTFTTFDERLDVLEQQLNALLTQDEQSVVDRFAAHAEDVERTVRAVANEITASNTKSQEEIKRSLDGLSTRVDGIESNIEKTYLLVLTKE